MDVLDAIMNIIADILDLNSIPGGTADMIVKAMSSFIQLIMGFVQMIQTVIGAVGTIS